LTGSADMSTAIQAVNEGSIYQFHPKPCPADTLGQAIKSGIDKYRKRTDSQTRMKKVEMSLEQASQIQQTLMPKSNPDVAGYDIAGQSMWCDETSGDYYDFIHPGDWNQEKVGIVVADVIGHGISAALLMTTVRASLRERILSPGNGPAIVGHVNNSLVKDIEQLNLFVTMFYSEIDLNLKCFRWVHAGHESALLYDMTQDSFQALGGDGVPLGVMANWAYEEAEIQITPGQIILIGTDGIKEACNPQGQYFGNDRLMRIIRKHAAEPAKDLLKKVFDGLNAFRFPAERKDDETLVIIKIQ
ncbi:MAG: SpoIIE family protein phosphatase, partial [Desulfobacterales bacterium]